jgi:hypothetical protein
LAQFFNLFLQLFDPVHQTLLGRLSNLGAGPDQKTQGNQHEQDRIDRTEYFAKSEEGIQKSGDPQHQKHYAPYQHFTLLWFKVETYYIISDNFELT